jgi:hypothetical protein
MSGVESGLLIRKPCTRKSPSQPGYAGLNVNAGLEVEVPPDHLRGL